MESCRREHQLIWLQRALYRCLAMIMVYAASPAVLASDWLIEPRVSLTGIVSDNLMLSPPGRESRGYVGRTVPSLAVQGAGRRISLDAYYQLENLVYPNNDSIFRNSTNFHQAKASGKIELAKDVFFIKGGGRFYQETLQPDDRLSYDNINPVDNKGNILTAYLSPYLKYDFGTKMHIDLLYERGHVDSRATGNMYDAESNRYGLSMDNHLSSSLVHWEVDYRRLDEFRPSEPDTVQESAQASLYYRIASDISLLIRNEHENNDIRTSRNIANGDWWGAGVLWEPSSKLLLEALYGDQGSEVDIKWRPNTRASVSLAYNYRKIGLIQGDSWRLDMEYRRRRIALKASYLEEVSSYQSLQLQEGNQTPLVDTEGNPVIDPVTNLPITTVDQFLASVNEDFLRKHGTVGVSYKTRRTSISLNGYAELRRYELTFARERLYGATMVWEWSFSRVMDVLMQAEGQRRSGGVNAAGDNLWSARLVLSRHLSSTLSSALEAQYIGRDALNMSNDFREKRLMVSINQRF